MFGGFTLSEFKRVQDFKTTVDVDAKIIQILNAMGRNPKLREYEYAIVCKAEKIQEFHYKVLPEFKIPKQKVSATTISITEPIDHDEFNCVIHAHPPGCNSFSQTDWNGINKNFELSLLYQPSQNAFVDGVHRYEIKPGLYLWIPVDINIIYDAEIPDLTQLIDQNIEKDYSSYYSQYHYSFEDAKKKKKKGLSSYLKNLGL